MYYNARYYDPNTARFISADTVVPGNASGGMDGIAVKPLTVSFSEPGFLSKANQENQFGPWFTLSDQERQQLGSPMGPVNPQALNRYAYVLNNPVRYVDPSGHFGVTKYSIGPIAGTIHLTHEEATAIWDFVNSGAIERIGAVIGAMSIKGAVDALTFATLAASMGASVQVVAIIWGASAIGLTAAEILTFLGGVGVVLDQLDDFYGNQGLDIHIPMAGAGVPIISAPTVAQQQGLWQAVSLFSPAELICSSLSECIY